MKSKRRKWQAVIIVATLTFLAVTLNACGEGNNIQAGSVELSGEEISSEDTHGAFHGDGYTLKTIICDASIKEEIKESGDWHSLPLPESLQTFVYQPYDDSLTIPEVENGYYYFYDRHDEAADPSDPADLLNRFSFNFSLGIYDSDTNIVYWLEYDS